MPAPVSVAGSYGNLINSVPVAAGATVGAFLDLSSTGNAAIEARMSCEFQTSGTAPVLPVIFSSYLVKGTPTTVWSCTNSTTIAVASKSGMNVGQKIALQQASGSLLGEIATISAISGTGPYTLTVFTLINTYSASDNVYLIDQTGCFPVTPGSSWAINSNYSASVFLGTGRWFVGVNNTTPTSVTASVSYDETTRYQ